MKFNTKNIFAALMLTMVFSMCGGGGSKSVFGFSDARSGTADGEYLDPGTKITVVHGGDTDSYVFEDEAVFDGCIEVDGVCLDVGSKAASEATCPDVNMQMDVIIVDGEIVDVICYLPPEASQGTKNYVEVTGEGGDKDIPQNENNKVIVFDEATDGEPIEGDVTVDSNNVAIYGNGMDKTIIDGDVTISGNNPILRGVTITGNLTINKNNAVVLFSRIKGNVYVNKNNVTMAENEIWGNVELQGANNAILVNNVVGGEWKITGSNHVCSGNSAFDDANADDTLTIDEVGAPLTCN